MGSPFNSSSSSSTTTTTATPNFDNLLLQSLMSRLQLHQQPPPSHRPLLSQSFEDLLDAPNFSFSDYDDDDDEQDGDFSDGGSGGAHRARLSKEELKLEKEIVKIIVSGDTQVLKANSGQAVSIGEHHVCIGFHEEDGSDYRVWEWHGHIMLFDDENGYTPEYIYGNYFERRFNFRTNNQKNNLVVGDDEEDESKPDNLGGLKDLIQTGDSTATRIIHQSRNAGSSRVLKGSSGN